MGNRRPVIRDGSGGLTRSRAGHGFDFCLLVKLKSLPPWGRWAFHDLQAGPSLSAPCP